MGTITLDLLFPPSTNRIWRHSRGHVYKTKDYVNWQSECDKLVMANGPFPYGQITGPFEFYLYLARNGRGDGDNRIKAVLDWLQSREIIRNDSDCQKGRWEWVLPSAAPTGCRVVLTY